MGTETNRMRDLLLTLLRPLVNHPDEIQINPIEKGHFVTLEVRVNKDDMGKIIGKGGRRAEALRTILKAQGSRLNKRVSLDILD